MYTCSGGVLLFSQYSDTACSVLDSTNPQPTGCQSGTVYTCVSSTPPPPPPPPATLSYVLYQSYYSADCTGTASTGIYVQNACLDSSMPNSNYYYSNKYTCNNNIPYGNSYTGSNNCTGLPSTYSYPVTCTTR